jgi:hypothetical protein
MVRSGAEWTLAEITPERKKREYFGVDLGHFRPKNGKKWPKKGQNRGFAVTSQLTMCFCIVLIL